MSVCTLFGHSNCPGLDRTVLQNALEELIQKGVDTFYVGTQGAFDRMAFACLRELGKRYPHIAFSAVLAYLPPPNSEYDPYEGHSVYPEGMEMGLRRFAIERRNQWMIERAEICLCYVTHRWGGAYKFARLAKRRGLKILNLSAFEI